MPGKTFVVRDSHATKHQRPTSAESMRIVT